MSGQLICWAVSIPEVCDALISGAWTGVCHGAFLIMKWCLGTICVVIVAMVEVSKGAIKSSSKRDVVW